MQEFDPRLSVAKVSPRVLIVGASMLALAVGWKLTENLRAPAGPVMDTATSTASSTRRSSRPRPSRA